MTYFPEIRTMADVPRFHGRTRPDTPALIFEGEITDYRDFDRHCSQVANGLGAMGVMRGDRVGFIGKNSAEYFELLFGAAKAGAVMVPISWRLAPMEVDYILRDSEIKALFVEDEFLPLIQRASAAGDVTVKSMDSHKTWLRTQSEADPMIPIDPRDIFIQLYTSGTTGHPKGVQIPGGNLYALLQLREESGAPPDKALEWNDWGPDDVSILIMPCFHLSGTGWGIVGLYAGAKNVILREFEPGNVLRAMHEHGGTKLLLVPTAIQMVLDHPDCANTDFSSLKYLCYGASPIPLPLLKRAMETFRCEFVQMYGLTETTGAIAYLPADDHDIAGNTRMRSAGKPVFGVELSIRDAEGRPVPTGVTGEICVRTPTIMLGYWKMPEETTKCIDTDGWFHTGDAGYLDADGYVYIQDRIKDMIVSGGVNIYPAEIENALFAHPDVSEAAVIGVPDSKWGESVLAFIVPKPGKHPDPKAIEAFCRERIAGYKIPRKIEFVDALPKNGTGKVMKTELRKPYWADQERQVG